MENPENVLMELNTYEKDPAGSLPKVLEEYLVFVAKTGNTVFPWPKIKPVVRTKLELIITDFNTAMPEEQVPKMPNVDTFKFTEMKQRIFEQLDSYSGIPFTMQRLCELLTQPKRHYKRVDKFMRGLEKVMLVVSTVEPLALNGEEGSSGRDRIDTDRKDREEDKSERDGDSITMESPSKRIRLSSAEEEEEEAGPCDSQDSVATVKQEKDTTPESEDVELDTITSGPVSVACPEESEVENMDIDTECTSSEARLSISPSSEDTVKEEESVCDSGTAAVTTSITSGTSEPTIATETEAEAASEAKPEAKVEMENEEELNVKTEVAVTEECETVDSSSTDGEACASLEPGPASVLSPPSREAQGKDTEAVKEKDEAAADCSSSDQAVEREPPSPTNSEAEPAKEVSESEEENNVEVKPDEMTDQSPDTASVESSEEVRNSKEEEIETEVNGAADSSDEAVMATVEKEQSPQQSLVQTEQELKGEDPSPDQSDTAVEAGSGSTDSA